MQSVGLSVCKPCSLSTCLYVHHAVCRLVCMITIKSVGLFVCTPCSLSACLCVHRAVCQPVWMYTMQSFVLSVCKPCCLSACLYVHRADCWPVCMYEYTALSLAQSHLPSCLFASRPQCWRTFLSISSNKVCQSVCTCGSFEMLVCWPVNLSSPSLLSACLCAIGKIVFLSGHLLPLYQIFCLFALACLPFVLTLPVRLSVNLIAFPPETCMTTFLPGGRPANLVTTCHACLSTSRSACQSAEMSVSCLQCPSLLPHQFAC
jgi:hypothetical protein